MKNELKDLKYVMLSGKFPQDKRNQELHNKSFLFWKNFWNRIFIDKGSGHRVQADTLCRQDLIGVLVHKERIVGQLLFTFFDYRSLAVKEHSYIVNNFSEEFFEILQQRKAFNIMTMESLAVESDWRKHSSGVSLSAVILTLTCKHLQEYQCDASIGAARSNSAVPDIIHGVGGETLVKNIELYEEPGELVAIFRDKIKTYPDLQVQALSERLWNEREDTTLDIPVVKKKTA